MIAGLLGLFTTHELLSPSPWVIGPQLAAVSLMIWARITFGRRSFHLAANPTAGGLVTTGPYGVIRHPIYSSVCLFALAPTVAYWSVSAVALFGLILVGGLLRMHCEESLLRQRYPEYAEYAATTWRMIPYVF
jgi:protein-S-isoprenylcysteine O-methyltransferase Ste14